MKQPGQWERAALWDYARRALVAVSSGGDLPPLPELPVLGWEYGCVVRLLGEFGEEVAAAGSEASERSFGEQLSDCIAALAAAADPDELDFLHLEITLVAPPRRIADPSEIRCGIDGVLLEWGEHAAALLPQLASEWHWDVPELLTVLVRKAGLAELPPTARLSVFEVAVLAENSRSQDR